MNRRSFMGLDWREDVHTFFPEACIYRRDLRALAGHSPLPARKTIQHSCFAIVQKIRMHTGDTNSHVRFSGDAKVKQRLGE
jgi:hypothetical protein